MKRGIPSRRWRFAGVLALLLFALILSGCGPSSPSHVSMLPKSPEPSSTNEVAKIIVLTSSAFHEGGAIPARYTCAGASISPPLTWNRAPSRTASFLLLMEDVTGAGNFTHWVLFNIPPDTNSLPANVPQGDQLASGARQGIDDAGLVGYLGPCPALPKGATDYYLFTLYALDISLNVVGGATKQDVLAAASGHLLAMGQLEGSYKLPQTPTPSK